METHWIKVGKRKPIEFQRVLCYKIDVALICLGVACWNGKNFLFDTTLYGLDEKNTVKVIKGVTHWAEITLPKD